MKNQELHDKAWKLLDEKKLNLSQKMMVMANFSDIFKDDYPFISIKYKKGEIEYFKSSIDDIDSYLFESKEEVIMANAIYENTKENFNPNDFIQQLKYTFRILGVKSEWSK